MESWPTLIYKEMPDINNMQLPWLSICSVKKMIYLCSRKETKQRPKSVVFVTVLLLKSVVCFVSF
jgi:hypothetical protein